MEQHRGRSRTTWFSKGCSASPLSGYGTSGLLNHFLQLLTDYRSVKTIDGDVKPIAFSLALLIDCFDLLFEVLAVLRNASDVTIHFGPVLNAIDTHDFLPA